MLDLIDFEALGHSVTRVATAHHQWAPVIVGVLAFCESLAFLSILVPATVILVGIGALIGATGLEFWPIWLGAALGAILGDWVSYSVGYYLKDRALTLWPLARYPEMVRKGQTFCQTWGAGGVFIGRFFGPLRAVVPLTAGVFAMPAILFQAANVSSAFVWSFVMLAPGALGVSFFMN